MAGPRSKDPRKEYLRQLWESGSDDVADSPDNGSSVCSPASPADSVFGKSSDVVLPGMQSPLSIPSSIGSLWSPMSVGYLDVAKSPTSNSSSLPSGKSLQYSQSTDSLFDCSSSGSGSVSRSKNAEFEDDVVSSKLLKKEGATSSPSDQSDKSYVADSRSPDVDFGTEKKNPGKTASGQSSVTGGKGRQRQTRQVDNSIRRDLDSSGDIRDRGFPPVSRSASDGLMRSRASQDSFSNESTNYSRGYREEDPHSKQPGGEEGGTDLLSMPNEFQSSSLMPRYPYQELSSSPRSEAYIQASHRFDTHNAPASSFRSRARNITPLLLPMEVSGSYPYQKPCEAISRLPFSTSGQPSFRTRSDGEDPRALVPYQHHIAPPVSSTLDRPNFMGGITHRYYSPPISRHQSNPRQSTGSNRRNSKQRGRTTSEQAQSFQEAALSLRLKQHAPSTVAAAKHSQHLTSSSSDSLGSHSSPAETASEHHEHSQPESAFNLRRDAQDVTSSTSKPDVHGQSSRREKSLSSSERRHLESFDATTQDSALNLVTCKLEVVDQPQLLDDLPLLELQPDSGYPSSSSEVTSTGSPQGFKGHSKSRVEPVDGGGGNAPYLCQVCGDISAGFHCGAYVCEACKVSLGRSGWRWL